MKVNIIMPAYNGHETIRQAVASVAAQDALEDILLTIVDDCSDEPYDYLLPDYKYMNIEILRKPSNTGCGQSRQYGIDHCRCECWCVLVKFFIYFFSEAPWDPMDGFGWWHPFLLNMLFVFWKCHDFSGVLHFGASRATFIGKCYS